MSAPAIPNFDDMAPSLGGTVRNVVLLSSAIRHTLEKAPPLLEQANDLEFARVLTLADPRGYVESLRATVAELHQLTAELAAFEKSLRERAERIVRDNKLDSGGR